MCRKVSDRQNRQNSTHCHLEYVLTKETKRQLVMHGIYSTTANWKTKLPRDISMHIWNYSVYFKIFSYLFHYLSPKSKDFVPNLGSAALVYGKWGKAWKLFQNERQFILDFYHITCKEFPYCYCSFCVFSDKKIRQYIFNEPEGNM